MSAADLDHFRDKRECPSCKNDKTKKPDLVFLIHFKCGHPICKTCVELRYGNKKSNKCHEPACPLILSIDGFRDQIFDDPQVDHEIRYRKYLEQIFNKTEEDFRKPGRSDEEARRLFYDYQEYYEDLVYNWVNNIDKASVDKVIQEYIKANKDNIEKNKKVRRNKLKEYQAKIMEIQLNEEHVEKTFRKEDQEALQRKMLALSKNSQQDNDLANKIAKNEGANAKEIIAQHEEDQKRVEASTKSLKRVKLDGNPNSNPDVNGSSLQENNPNADSDENSEAGYEKINRITFRSFRFIDKQVKVALPTDKKWIGYRYEELELQKRSCLMVKTAENAALYRDVFNQAQAEDLRGRSLQSLDLNCILQRTLNDAFNCLE